MACSSNNDNTTAASSEGSHEILVSETIVYDDESPIAGEIENFIIKDINGNKFDLHEELESKAVIILYTDIINNVEAVTALDKYIFANNELYSPIVMDYNSDAELVDNHIKVHRHVSPVFLDSNLRMFNEFKIDIISTTLVIGKDKQIKAYIKRDVLDSALYHDMLKGVIQ